MSSSRNLPQLDAPSGANPEIRPSAAISFLEDAAVFFERLPTRGEDSAYWSNVYNAENCRKIARLIGATLINQQASACDAAQVSPPIREDH